MQPTRSRAVATDDLVLTVAVSPDPCPPTVYEQAVKVFARLDESLALCGTDKSKILSAMIYLNDVTQKGEFIESFSSSILLGFPSKPADLAGTCAFLASSESDYITGQIIMCDGGMILV